MGKKIWPKSAKKSQNSVFGRPCLRAGPKGQPQARRRCGPEGPAPEAPRLPAEGRQASNSYFNVVESITIMQLFNVICVRLILSNIYHFNLSFEYKGRA